MKQLNLAAIGDKTYSADAQGYVQLLNDYGPQLVAPANLAAAYAAAGNRERAIQELQRAYAEQDQELVSCIRFPTFDPLRGDPRFRELMKKLGLPD
jgi:hypothetical protein